MENEIIHEDQEDIYHKPVEVVFGQDQVPSKVYVLTDSNIWLQRMDVIKRLEQERKVVMVVPNKVEQEIRGLKNSQNENTRERAIFAHYELMRLVNDARHQREDQRTIMGQHQDDYKLVKKEFPARPEADNQIVESALILKRRGLNVKMATLDQGMDWLCFGSGIELYELGPHNQSN